MVLNDSPSPKETTWLPYFTVRPIGFPTPPHDGCGNTITDELTHTLQFYIPSLATHPFIFPKNSSYPHKSIIGATIILKLTFQ